MAKTTLEERYSVLKKKQSDAHERFRNNRIRQYREFLHCFSPNELAKFVADTWLLTGQEEIKRYASNVRAGTFDSLEDAAIGYIKLADRHYQEYETEWAFLYDTFIGRMIMDNDLAMYHHECDKSATPRLNLDNCRSVSDVVDKHRRILTRHDYLNAAVRAKRLTDDNDRKIDSCLLRLRISERAVLKNIIEQTRSGIREMRDNEKTNTRVMW